MLLEKLEIVNIINLLSIENLVIPPYQRPYRWTKESALVLFNDIYSAFKKDKEKEYRIGTVILHKDNDKYNIVDGQQRITTVSILMYCLENILVKDPLNDITHKLNEKLLKIEYSELSWKSIIENYQILNRKCKELGEDLKGFAKYLLDKCTFVKIVTDSEQEAFQFFDSQNSRGKDLAPHDLLKAYHLREMNFKDEYYQAKELINDWENINQDELDDLFRSYLYPIIKWSKEENGLYFNKNKIDTFKGIKKSFKYNYAVYHKASNFEIEQNNNDLCYLRYNSFSNFQEKIFDFLNLLNNNEPNIRFNQFQLNQPIIDGKRFFKYILHYYKLLDDLETKIKKLLLQYYEEKGQGIDINKLLPENLAGDIYVKNLLYAVIMLFVDKFNLDELTITRLKLFYNWSYSLRLKLRSVSKLSINKYALGLNDLNYGINLFSIISEIKEPQELDLIELATHDNNKDNNGNNKYGEIEKFINGDKK